MVLLKLIFNSEIYWWPKAELAGPFLLVRHIFFSETLYNRNNIFNFSKRKTLPYVTRKQNLEFDASENQKNLELNMLKTINKIIRSLENTFTC